MSLLEEMTELAHRSKEASRALASLSREAKNDALGAMADALEAAGPKILKANAEDLKTASEMGLSAPMQERLELTEKRIAKMAQGVRDVVALPDPVGRILEERTRPNGLKLQKVSTPIGVILIIYESRPNVTADAASLCFKSGNATILRGGKEALQSNRVIAETMVRAARDRVQDFPEAAIQVVPTTDREAVTHLLSMTDLIDLCIPRGGENLIRSVAETSKVPVIKHYKGVCHVFIDREADPQMAKEIAVNAKTQRPSVCNAMETLLVDEAIAASFLPELLGLFLKEGVSLRVDKKTRAYLSDDLAPQVSDAGEEDWTAEYNDLTLSVKTVTDVTEGIEHINRFGSNHSDSIVTANAEHAKQFLNGVDAAAVYWNASTRFTDGAEFGMGAEIGVSTDKIGARGPMGLEELTSYKWIGLGNGQLRTS